MARKKKGPNNALLSSSLEPVKHLSPGFQRKLLKREQKQHKVFRSSGKPYPLVNVQSPSMSVENTPVRDLVFGVLLVLAELD